MYNIQCRNIFTQIVAYGRSGNFRVMKLSYDAFLCWEILVGMTTHCINNNSVHVFS